MGQDVAVIVVVLVVIGGLIGLLVFGLMHFKRAIDQHAKSPKENASRVETATKATAPSAPAVRRETSTAKPREPAVEKARKATPVEVPAGLAKVDLGKDPAGMRDILECEVTGFDLRNAKFTFRNVRKPAVVQVSQGLRLVPKGNTNSPVYVVIETKSFGVQVTNADIVVYVPVAGMDSRSLFVSSASLPFEIAVPPEKDPIVEFLSLLSSRTASWNTVQVGVWVLAKDVSRQEVAGYKLRFSDPGAPGGVREESLASFENVKTVEAILSILGKDPDAFRLIKEEHQERNRLVTLLDFEKPGPGFMSVLQSKAVARYTGDSEVERLLRRYMTQHRRQDVRRLALENLLLTGLIGTPEDLLRTATWDTDMNIRLVAATALFAQGDARALPFLAGCADDPILSTLCGPSTEAAIARKSGQARNTDETMVAYWNRVLGIASLKLSSRDAANLRPGIEKLISKQDDAAIIKALADIVSSDDSVATSACHALARFNRNPRAFEAVCRRAASQDRSVPVRQQAIYSLAQFRDFPLATVCEPIMKQDNEALVYAVLNLVKHNQFIGFENTVMLGLKHASAGVRRESAEVAGQSQMLEAERVLVKMVDYDGDHGVKEAALMALGAMRSRESLSLCQSLLRSGERNNKYRAVRCLAMWGNDSAAVELLQKYKNDPDLGGQIKAQLDSLSRR